MKIMLTILFPLMYFNFQLWGDYYIPQQWGGESWTGQEFTREGRRSRQIWQEHTTREQQDLFEKYKNFEREKRNESPGITFEEVKQQWMKWQEEYNKQMAEKKAAEEKAKREATEKRQKEINTFATDLSSLDQNTDINFLNQKLAQYNIPLKEIESLVITKQLNNTPYRLFPLQLAAAVGNKNIVEYLLKNGFDFHRIFEKSETPLLLAYKFKHHDAINTIFDYIIAYFQQYFKPNFVIKNLDEFQKNKFIDDEIKVLDDVFKNDVTRSNQLKEYKKIIQELADPKKAFQHYEFKFNLSNFDGSQKPISFMITHKIPTHTNSPVRTLDWKQGAEEPINGSLFYISIWKGKPDLTKDRPNFIYSVDPHVNNLALEFWGPITPNTYTQRDMFVRGGLFFPDPNYFKKIDEYKSSWDEWQK